ncbi:hypothetical protein [Amycolatopsis regifaucium]|uniref:Uncharacterized protein n=1 Tax=Amycolatopsis regifaucium TaxID=546365 RepID=A0A154M3Y4_9PSEU|nr:hypothetical protein [Amycolatopsis regifaucium]KZB79150.1 hypothetical protein AVL48_16205 [Amycolatopsis regifaucium]OKA07334.1 hypothetical protein ATP06_0215885 [Amycolatopsis regifaucium]SFH14087.1 hypothetical protein SAMN04489731_102637 [Amycolatopsis regifaucium]
MDVTKALKSALTGSAAESRYAVRELRRETEDLVARRAGRTANRLTELGGQLADLVLVSGSRLAGFADRHSKPVGEGVRREAGRIGDSVERLSATLSDRAILIAEELIDPTPTTRARVAKRLPGKSRRR